MPEIEQLEDEVKAVPPPPVEEEEEDKQTAPTTEVSMEDSLEMKKRGNEFFALKQFREAMEEYTDALEASPVDEAQHRAILFANRAACYYELGFYDSCVRDSDAAVELNDGYAKAFLRRYRAHEKLDKLDEALEDCSKALELAQQQQQDGNSRLITELQSDKTRLSALVAEKNKKLQEEMLGKLKEMGNMFLGKFGMSLDNFNAEQDPNTGSYSINFKQ